MSADASVPAAAVPPPAVVVDDAAVSPPPPAVPAPSAAVPPFVYAIGRIEPRFPSLAVEKELAQVTGRAETVGLTDSEVLRTVLTDRAYRYLVRQLAWVFTVEGIETYLLVPRDPADLELLVDAVRYGPRDDDRDVVIGIRGALAPADMARGLVVPVVYFDQIYSFDTESLIAAIPRPDAIAADRFEAASRELFIRVQLVADNAGATDEHRALNYLVVRYPRIYEMTAEALGRDSSLTAVDVRPSALSGARTVVDVVFDFTNRQTDVVESFFVRVDVTEEFPFLVTKLSPYYRR
jgi:hypothetical protein